MSEIATKFPDLGYLLSVKGSAFEAVMGSEWAGKHAEIPLFQPPDAVGRLLERNQLEVSEIRAAMELFLSDARVFDDGSDAVDSVRSAYRELYLRLVPDFWNELEARLQGSFDNPEAHRRAAILGLSMFPTDPWKDPHSSKIWFAAGWASGQLKDLARAENYLEQSLALAPLDVLTLGELATLRLEQGRSEDGAALLNRVLELDPNNLLGLCNFAALYIQTGVADKARPYLERAKAIAPEDHFLKHLLGKLPPYDGVNAAG
ncbi:MAG: hypothetical protein HY928_13210 [Elusimicrobia bacterium]|nr:hypothetical protein [Elusimicrobiota bacterium]